MSLWAVLASDERRESPTVKATMRPACLTVLGYALPSRRVSRAVERVRMMVQLACETPTGQVGATSGEDVAPSSTMAADAAAGASPAPAATAAVVIRMRFIWT